MGFADIFKPKQFKPSASATEMPEFKIGAVTSDIKMPDRVGPITTSNLKAYQAKTVGNIPLAEYDAVREKAVRDSQGQDQEQQEALRRRFAAMGGLNTGAAIKAQQNSTNSAMQRRQDALNNIGFQEAQQRRAMQERENTQEFQSGEAYKAREADTERFNADLAFKNNVSQFDAQSKLRQLDLQHWQIQMDAANTQFNKELAMYSAKNSGGLFGAGGFLGTGIGN